MIVLYFIVQRIYMSVIMFSIVIPKLGTYLDKSFGGMSVAASNCKDSMLSSPNLEEQKNDNVSAILCDMQAPIPIASHSNTLSYISESIELKRD